MNISPFGMECTSECAIGRKPCPAGLFNILPARQLPHPIEVNLSRGREIPTGLQIQRTFILKGLQTAFHMLYTKTDEVARNGVLQRITSARGFLGHPLHYQKAFVDCTRQPSPAPLVGQANLRQRHGLCYVNPRLP